jgi:hypothetical protein
MHLIVRVTENRDPSYIFCGRKARARMRSSAIFPIPDSFWTCPTARESCEQVAIAAEHLIIAFFAPSRAFARDPGVHAKPRSSDERRTILAMVRRSRIKVAPA